MKTTGEKNKLCHVILKTALIYQWSHGTSICISSTQCALTHTLVSLAPSTQNTKRITASTQCWQKCRNKAREREREKLRRRRLSTVTTIWCSSRKSAASRAIAEHTGAQCAGMWCPSAHLPSYECVCVRYFAAWTIFAIPNRDEVALL